MRAVTPKPGSESIEEQIVIVNWPHAIAADRSAHLGGIIPVIPPALFMDAPDVIAPSATWVQYLPWQQQAQGLDVEYCGPYVTQAELAGLVQRAERAVMFSPQIQRMVVLAGERPMVPSSGCIASFGEQVFLVAAQATQQEHMSQIGLTWQVTGMAPTDTTIFVHIIDANDNLTAQADGDPAGGLVPLASLSTMNSALHESRMVSIPPGDYRVRIGVYNRASGERLVAHCSPSSICVGDAVQVGFASSVP